MRAVVVREFGPFEAHEVEEFPPPAPGPEELLIDVHSCGLNFSDTLIVQGRYQRRPDRPFVPGRDAAGIVAAVGASVTRCKPGDRVIAVTPFGAYAEQLAAHQNHCFVMPDNMDFATGAAMGNVYLTAYVAAWLRGRLQPGETVLVTGASGGVGLACVELANAKGATVIAGVTSADKGALVKRHGAAHIVDLSSDDLRDGLRDQVAACTNGRGADMVLDPVGGDVFDSALRTLAPGGRLVSIGFASGRAPEAKANYLLLKNITVMGAYLDPLLAAEPERIASAACELFDLYGAGKIRPEITATYKLEDFRTALGRFGAGGMQGKIVLTMGRD
ncbi:MAG: NADPH:quinone oxidoreductase family protein [Alphaproteobacteria bacterium]